MRCWRQHFESQPHHPSPSSHTQRSRIICYLCKLECSGLVAVSWMFYGYSHPSLLHLLGSWIFLSSMLRGDTMGLVLLFWPLQKGFRNTVKHGGKKTQHVLRKGGRQPVFPLPHSYSSSLFYLLWLLKVTFTKSFYSGTLWQPCILSRITR